MNGSNCYFIDITNNFIQHYFELLSTDTKTLEKMYVCTFFFSNILGSKLQINKRNPEI